MTEKKYIVKFGSVEPKIFNKYENGRMVTYSYSIEMDLNGREISRTEPTRLGSIGYDDGSEFNEDDYNYIVNGTDKPRLSIIDRLMKRIRKIRRGR